MAEPTAADDNSRQIRMFISSTFRDFMEERVEVVDVDLRWGVTQAQVEDGHALEICLKEIERCRPSFIGMLGDSYGSLTPSERQLLTAAPELLEKRQWLAGNRSLVCPAGEGRHSRSLPQPDQSELRVDPHGAPGPAPAAAGPAPPQ